MSLLRNRPFRRFVAAKVSNKLADTISAVALPLIALGISGNPVLVGVASCCAMGGAHCHAMLCRYPG